MAKKFRDLRSKMSPEAQKRANHRTQEMLGELPLHALRKARELSQKTMAEMLGATQPQISKIEHRADLYVSTLRKYIEALGGQLEIVATFPDGSVRVNLFQELDAAATPSVGVATTVVASHQFVFTSVENVAFETTRATVSVQLDSMAVAGVPMFEVGKVRHARAADTRLVLAA